MNGLKDGVHVHFVAPELPVSDRHDGAVELLARQLAHDVDAILPLHHRRISPGVIDRNADVVFLKRAVDIDDAGIAHIGAVLLERESHYEHIRVQDLNALLEHQLDDLVRDVCSHSVVHAAPGEDDFGVVPQPFRALREVIGVHRNAMPAHEAGVHLDEIPLRAGGLEHVLRVDAHQGEDLREFVDEGDVDVALRILDDLRGLGYLDGRGLVRAVHQDGIVHAVNEIRHFRGGAGGDLQDLLDRMLLVAGIDALGAVAREEILVEFQAGDLLHHGNALVLGDPGVNRGLVNDYVSLAYDLANRRAGAVQRSQVRVVVPVHGCRYGYDVEIAAADLLQVGGTEETMVVDGVL